MNRSSPPFGQLSAAAAAAASAGIAVVLLLVAASAAAQTPPAPGAPTGNLGDFNTFGSTWQTFITGQLQPQLNAILSGAGGEINYVTWASTMVGLGFTITTLISLYKWVLGAASGVDVVTVFARGVIISILYVSYSSWTSLFFNAAYELSFLIQQQALNDNTMMGPAVFIAKAMSSIGFGTGSFFSLTLSAVIYGTFFSFSKCS
jgi:hypothetical protein